MHLCWRSCKDLAVFRSDLSKSNFLVFIESIKLSLKSPETFEKNLLVSWKRYGRCALCSLHSRLVVSIPVCSALEAIWDEALSKPIRTRHSLVIMVLSSSDWLLDPYRLQETKYPSVRTTRQGSAEVKKHFNFRDKLEFPSLYLVYLVSKLKIRN